MANLSMLKLYHKGTSSSLRSATYILCNKKWDKMLYKTFPVARIIFLQRNVTLFHIWHCFKTPTPHGSDPYCGFLESPPTSNPYACQMRCVTSETPLTSLQDETSSLTRHTQTHMGLDRFNKTYLACYSFFNDSYCRIITFSLQTRLSYCIRFDTYYTEPAYYWTLNDINVIFTSQSKWAKTSYM